MRPRKRARLAEMDRDGVVDTTRQRYLDEHWSVFRRHVKIVQATCTALRMGFGLGPVRIDLPLGWGQSAAYEDAVREDLYGLQPARSKASKGGVEQQTQALGWRDERDHEWHADIDEYLESEGPDPDPFNPHVRAALFELLYDYREDVENHVGVLMGELMTVPLYSARECDSAAPLGDLWYAGRYPMARTNWALDESTGEYECWTLADPRNPHKIRSRVRGTRVHELFALHHGWHVPAFERRGHGEDWKGRAQVEKIEQALKLVREGHVPALRPKRGRPDVVWVVLDALGRRGIRSCIEYAGRFKVHDDIEDALDREYAEQVRALVDLIPVGGSDE